MPKVSVVIPVYRQAHYVAAAIASVLAQTLEDIEIIVVDDGSPDDVAGAVARASSDRRITLIRQENKGLAGARNSGLAAATGDFLCFLDADDTYEPEKLEKQVRLLESSPDLGWAYCDIITTSATGEPLEEQFRIADQPRELSGDIFGSLLQGGFFPPHTVMVRRSVLQQEGGFDPVLGGHADYELWLRISGAGHRAGFIPEPLVRYRTHGESMSKDGRHMDETRRAALVKIFRLFPERAGAGVHLLQQDIQNLFTAHQWLRLKRESGELMGGGGSAGGVPATMQAVTLLPLLRQAQRVKGQPDQVAVWDSQIGGRAERCLYLQPPAELLFRVPTGAAGTLVTAVSVHEEAWNKPTGGGCEFHLRADGRVIFVIAIDPFNLPEDRIWHEVRLALPHNAKGWHDITLETRPIGNSNAFRWGVWRAPVFLHSAETENVTTT